MRQQPYKGLAASDRELRSIIRRAGMAHEYVRREVLWEWPLSRVERVQLDGGDSLIVKRSRRPLIDEGRILRHLGRTNIPLAKLYLSRRRDGVLTMVMEDLGPAVREATLREAALAAVRTHAASPPRRLHVLDQAGLADLSTRALDALDGLERAGRWRIAGAVRSTLVRLERVAQRLSQEADLPPFGLCHSEFHPLSLHIGSKGAGLVDWARAFVGPGLLDLASYSGTVRPPDPAACRALIDAYVAEGGAPEARAARAGLPAERWALFWHRVWTAEWFASSCATWMTDTTKDARYQTTVQRHLEEALALAGG